MSRLSIEQIQIISEGVPRAQNVLSYEKTGMYLATLSFQDCLFTDKKKL
jgi:hypothetical protein